MKERKLDKVYNEIKNMPEEEMKKQQEELTLKIEKLEKEVNAKQEKSINVDETKKELDEAKKKLENFKGYSKNKVQIEKIRNFREKLSGNLKKEMISKDKSAKMLEKAKKDYEKISKKLEDPSKTEKLDNNEYNDLLIKQEDIKKDIEMYKDAIKQSEKKIDELKTKISKCNLAWRTLFVNKDWDEIQVRAMSSNTKFTRKVKMQEENQQEATADESTRARVAGVVAGILNSRQNEEEQNEEEQNEEENKLPAKTGRFRRLFSKMAAWFKTKKEQVSNKIQGNAEKPEKDKDENGKRDAFIEGLRQYADEEYRKEVRENKEKEYIEKHKATEQNER